MTMVVMTVMIMVVVVVVVAAMSLWPGRETWAKSGTHVLLPPSVQGQGQPGVTKCPR